ncbi:pyruvate dehydrogenase complex dihydrolipoamide acetyltransferase [Flavobacterium antarcticum]|uniref:pyruvate dehydrogenase complex dihydrolipoamide acetyltransferase n=1 Tax=Flavobacterium antarcticum TaxID=271155 RepID=UPI0003B71B6C|nr:pyruvate dehydrogenase complex dihydrolipoamide acetyltransferase [Flavobacterium antarcticum]
MAIVITMPRLSDTMTEGTVATWLKKVGDKISEGDILAEIETDKATMEFESFNSGTLLHIGIQEGESAPIDSLLAIIGKEGEDISELLKGNSTAEEKSDDKKESSDKEEAPKSEDNAVEKNSTESKSAELPKGVVVVTMPRLSDTMTDGTVATWLKKVGDKISEGDILAEIETDKATMEFESFNAGTLLFIGIQEGETAPVDSLLAIIGPEGTDVSGISGNFGNKDSKATESKEADSKEEKSTETKEEKTASTETVSENNNASGRIFASPLAKKIAEEKGINLNDVKGSGENGRIVKSDVEQFSPAKQEAKTESVSASASAPTPSQALAPKMVVPAGEVVVEEVKNSQMRKIIAKRLSESKFTAPHYYLKIEVTMDAAMESRSIINSIPDTKVSFNDLVIKASAMALKKHPKVNSQWKDEATIINHHVNIGVAVAVEDGLVVPVLKFTDLMSLTQIGGSVKDLAGRAKNKKLQPAEMEGSTFTVSNLGMFGIVEFTSIINQPNSAILSVGAIVEKPVVKNGQIVVGNTMMLTLACDHRTVDGATGAQFLQTLKQYMENPVTMLA